MMIITKVPDHQSKPQLYVSSQRRKTNKSMTRLAFVLGVAFWVYILSSFPSSMQVVKTTMNDQTLVIQRLTKEKQDLSQELKQLPLQTSYTNINHKRSGFSGGTLSGAKHDGVTFKIADESNTNSTIQQTSRKRSRMICRETSSSEGGESWKRLCEANLIYYMDQILAHNHVARVIQIGAHVGFEANDPIAQGMMRYLALLSEEEKKRVQWTFVEASPVNYKTLQTTMEAHSELADLRSKHVGVVSDSLADSEVQSMIFHSISEDIDPITGYDKRSGKKFPYWATQISSFSLRTLNRTANTWSGRGLNQTDYIVDTNVTTLRYSDLMEEIMEGDDPANSLTLVLIDTEGFDCQIVKGIAATSPYAAPLLLFEDKNCPKDEKKEALAHLHDMDYHTVRAGSENIVAWK